jgi:hypothetical protein
MGFDNNAACKLFGGILCIVNGGNHLSAGHGDSVPCQECLGLIFMDLHVESDVSD